MLLAGPAAALPNTFFAAVDDGRTQFDSTVATAGGTVQTDQLNGLASATSWSRAGYTISASNGAARSINDTYLATAGGGVTSGDGINMTAAAAPNDVGSGLTFTFNTPINAFGIELGDWATCCYPSGLYIQFDGGQTLLVGSATQATDDPSFVKYGEHKTFIGAIDDNATFSVIRLYGDGNGDVLYAGGTIRYAIVPLGSVSGNPPPPTRNSGKGIMPSGYRASSAMATAARAAEPPPMTAIPTVWWVPMNTPSVRACWAACSSV